MSQTEMTQKYVMVIDRGSTNIKVVLFDLQGREKKVVSRPCEAPVSIHYGWCEQDMDKIWDSTKEGIRQMTEELEPGSEILGVSVSGQGSGIFILDKEGNPARAGILSLDTRPEKILKAWEKDGTADWWYEQTHGNLLFQSPACYLRWIKENEPEVYGKIGAFFFSKDWVRYKLTGEIATEITDASPGAMLAGDEKSYFYEGFDRLGIPEMKDALPRLLYSGDPAGVITDSAANETGLKAGIPVFAGAHDMMASAFGVGNLSANQVVCVVGTWGANYVIGRTRKKKMSFPHIAPGYYLTGLLDGNSGSVQDYYIDKLYSKEKAELSQKDLYKFVEDSVLKSKPNQILFLPYLYGGLFEVNTAAGFIGVRNWHTRDEMMRAVFEGITFGHYANIQELELDQMLTEAWVIGGGAKSKVLGQLFADLMGIPVKIAECEEIPSRAVALTMLVSLGICKSYEEACIPAEVKKIYEPDPKRHAYYQKKYKLFRKAMQESGELWDELAEIRVDQTLN